MRAFGRSSAMRKVARSKKSQIPGNPLPYLKINKASFYKDIGHCVFRWSGRGLRVKKREEERKGREVRGGGDAEKWKYRVRHVPIIRNDTKKNVRVRENLRVYRYIYE